MIEEASGDLFQWFRSFYHVATSGSFTAAAKLLHRNQGAVSYQIKSLEKELGVVLLHRLKNGIELTAEGDIVFKWILRTFDNISGMRQELGWCNKRGICRISASRPTLVSNLFMASLREFHHRWPNIHVYLNNSTPHRVYRELQKGNIDFALYGNARTATGLEFFPLFKSPCLLVINRHYGAGLDSRPTLPQLQKLLYIPLNIDQSGLPLHQTFLPGEISHLFQGISWLSCISFQVILRYISQSDGCTVVDAWSLRALQEYVENLDLYCLDHLVPPVEYGLLTREDYAPGPAVNDFRQLLKQNMANISLEEEASRLCARK